MTAEIMRPSLISNIASMSPCREVPRPINMPSLSTALAGAAVSATGVSAVADTLFDAGEIVACGADSGATESTALSFTASVRLVAAVLLEFVAAVDVALAAGGATAALGALGAADAVDAGTATVGFTALSWTLDTSVAATSLAKASVACTGAGGPTGAARAVDGAARAVDGSATAKVSARGRSRDALSCAIRSAAGFVRAYPAEYTASTAAVPSANRVRERSGAGVTDSVVKVVQLGVPATGDFRWDEISYQRISDITLFEAGSLGYDRGRLRACRERPCRTFPTPPAFLPSEHSGVRVTEPIVPSDIEIAQSAKLRHITAVAEDLGLTADDIDMYGKYKAKLPLEISARPPRGRLVLVTAINPTPAGEGKSTVSVGLAQAFRRIGTNAVLCIREPSLGPVFGVKGGAAGGGYAQVLPMDDINLHFTGDFHAIASAHALLSALMDNHLQQGNALNLDPRRITWPRTIDMNDRVLRKAIIGLGGPGEGIPREERWVIIPASEIMAILALATSVEDLEVRLGRIIVGATAGANKQPVRASDLKAQGAMTLLLKDAIRPNLVQTLEGGPALVHCGPFGNIAHGCNSLMATRAALALGDVVVTEAGFGSDLGAEKFFDIKCRFGGLNPEAAVVVATVRSLKMQGGAPKNALQIENLDALEKGMPNLAHHVANVQQYGVPVIVAINRRQSDTPAELALVEEHAKRMGVKVALCDVWARGGEGGEALARGVLELLEARTANFKPIYDTALSIREKIDIIVRKVYGAEGADITPAAGRAIDYLESIGLGDTPVCMAKTQYSLTDDATKLGRPTGFRITVNEVYGSAGAGFVVCKTGDVMTMPGLGKVPAAEGMRLLPNGTIEGLS